MENQEQGDDALAKRKAELLTILEATLIVNNSNHTQNDVSKSLSNENKTFMPASTVKMDAVENGRTEDTEINSVKKYTPSKKLNEPVADENHSLSDSESARSDGCKINLDKNSVDIKLNFDTPLMVLNYEKEFSSSENTFTKGCKWSPDGSCLLVGCEDRKLRLFNLPNPVSCGDCQDEKWFLEDYQYYNKPALTVKEGEALFDYTWYPSMNSYAPDTCCFAVTCRDLPVHLFDAWNGSLICSYQAYNHLDQLVAAHSVSFNLDGSLLVCGFKKCLRVFNTCRPGREFDVIEAK
ncbi:Telomerase Cajal body protein 1, partial [Halocaridina rubra]